MSADNFYLVRKQGGRFYVTMLFASDYENAEPWPPLMSVDRAFNTLEDVQHFLHDLDNWAEYPPIYDFPTKVVEVLDTELSTGEEIEVLEALLRQVEEALIWTSGSPDFGPGGQAEQGWNRLCRPLIQAIHEHLGEKVLNAKP